ncbi:Lrp/AsnC family transcriptional regulator [Candidatus Micrarchaeota archaeon]|nr:Lrp/AsnC family transcriptional regulator [Candidatus Micrarchaeota archaeon]
MIPKLDTYDKKILYELDVNSRISVSNLARKVRLPKETVNYRLKRLVEKKYVRDLYAIINASHFGYRYYKISFKFHSLDTALEKEIVEYLKNEKSCANLRITEGAYDIVFLGIHKTSGDLKEFLENFSRKFGMYLVDKNIQKIVTSYKINQKILYDGKTSKKIFYHAEPVDYQPEQLDLKILKALSKQARIKLIDLARKLEDDPRVLKYHIKKMESKGIIVGYASTLNFKLFGLEFIQIDISLKHHGLISKIIDFFDETRTCVFAYEILGKQDLSLELYVENDEQLRRIIVLFKENFKEYYISYEVSRIYREYMSNWSPFEM